MYPRWRCTRVRHRRPNQMGGRNGQIGSAQEAAHNIPHGMGQSKSSRRRRRKRKNKSATRPASAGRGGQFVGDDPGQWPGRCLTRTSQPQNFQPAARSSRQARSIHQALEEEVSRSRPAASAGESRQPGQRRRISATATARGYRDKDTHQPGNSVCGFKRKGKQRERGPRSFVGPMDHSYRAVNGNFADAPPSTIEAHGNYQGRGGGGGRSYVSDSQPIDYSVGRPIPIPEDAPTKIFFFIEDLFFNAKITETARKLGVKVAFVKNDKEAIAELTGGDEADRPGLIVFDLNNANVKPLTLIPKLKAKLKKSTSIIGFLSHLQGDLKAKAVEAGCDTVMPRAAFSQNLPNLLRRYGLQPEEEESNFNQ